MIISNFIFIYVSLIFVIFARNYIDLSHTHGVGDLCYPYCAKP
jgi:hypothetical protein